MIPPEHATRPVEQLRVTHPHGDPIKCGCKNCAELERERRRVDSFVRALRAQQRERESRPLVLR